MGVDSDDFFPIDYRWASSLCWWGIPELSVHWVHRVVEVFVSKRHSRFIERSQSIVWHWQNRVCTMVCHLPFCKQNSAGWNISCRQCWNVLIWFDVHKDEHDRHWSQVLAENANWLLSYPNVFITRVNPLTCTSFKKLINAKQSKPFLTNWLSTSLRC